VQQTLTAYMLPMAAMVLWHGACPTPGGASGDRGVDAALRAGLAGVRVCRQHRDPAGRPALQGISAGAGMVVGRAVVRDLMEGPGPSA
jgi:DHA1 family bicyclomycin/chloramphenicol resistance-like MFS transporter